MASIKTVGKYLHLEFYDPAVGYSRTRSLNLTDTPDGWKEAKKELKKANALRTLRKPIFEEERKSRRANIRLSQLPDLYIKDKRLSGEGSHLYKYAAEIMIQAVGDLYIWQVSGREYSALLDYLDKLTKSGYVTERDESGAERKVRGKTDQPISKNTKNNITKHLRILFAHLQQQGDLEENPIIETEYQKKRPRRIPKESLLCLLNYLYQKEDLEHFRVTLFMLLTGYRLGSVIALKWSDIYFDYGLIETPNKKGKRDDDFPMPQMLRDILIKQKERDYPDNKVFRFNSRHSFKFYTRALDKCGLPHYTLHQCRKTFASMLGNAGFTLDDVARLAGHKSKETTEDAYYDIDLERLRREMDEVFNREFPFVIK